MDRLLQRWPLGRRVVTNRLEEVRCVYDQGGSLAKVAERFGVDPGTVRYAFREAGMPRRATHGR